MEKIWNNLFSDNIRDFKGYSIGKLLQYVKDPDIISFAVGMPSPDTFPKELLRSASERILRKDIDHVLQYSPIPGEESLFESIIDFLKWDNIDVKKENILITSSGQHGLDLVGRLFLNPGDPLILERPSFGGALVAFEMEKPRFIGVDLEEDGINIVDLHKKLEESKNGAFPHPKFIYVVPDFQNPSGITMSLEKRKILLDLCYEYDIPIVEDSPYRPLRYRGDSIPSIFSIDQDRKGTNVIGIYTFSKILTPGLRVGFNIGDPTVIGKMTNIKEANLLNTPKWNQDICAIFLKEVDLDKHFKKMQDYYRKKLEKILTALDEYLGTIDGISWTKPDGGFFLWITTPPSIDTMKLFYEAVAEKVAFVPGEASYGENPEKNHMRINFSYPSEDQLKEGIRRLANCFKKCM